MTTGANLAWADSMKIDLQSLGVDALAPTVMVGGYDRPGDGGGGTFVWSSSPDKADGGTFIVPKGAVGDSGPGWRRLYSGAVNVRWFGARGHFPAPSLLTPADDTASIQRAINAAARQSDAGGAVYFPPGTYAVGTQVDDVNQLLLDLPSRVTLYGDGRASVLKIARKSKAYRAIFGSSTIHPAGITLRDLCFDQNPEELAGKVNDVQGIYQYVVALQDCTDLRIEDCAFRYCGVNAVNVSGSLSTRTRIVGSTFEFVYQHVPHTPLPSYDNSGIYIHSTNHVIANNVFVAPISTVVGGAIESHLGPSVVIGNIIDGFGVGMNIVSGDNQSPDPIADANNISVTGNSLVRVNAGIVLWAARGAPSALAKGPDYTLRNVTLTGNTISIANEQWASKRPGGNSNRGISLHSNSVMSPGNYSGITMTGNTVAFDTQSGPATGGGATFTSGIACSPSGDITNVLIAANSILHSPCKGIDISVLDTNNPPFPQGAVKPRATGMRITGNLIANPGTDNSPPAQPFRAAIHSEARQLVDCLVDGNHVCVEPGFASGKIHSVNISAGPGSSGCGVRDNRVTTAGAIPLYAAVGPGILEPGGSTRPPSPAKWESFYDENLGKPIWYDGTKWVDAKHNTV